MMTRYELAISQEVSGESEQSVSLSPIPSSSEYVELAQFKASAAYTPDCVVVVEWGNEDTWESIWSTCGEANLVSPLAIKTGDGINTFRVRLINNSFLPQYLSGKANIIVV